VVWSDEIHRIHGTPQGFKPTFQKALSFVHPDSRAAFQQAMERCREAGEAFHIEVRIVRTDQTIRDVEIIGESERDGAGSVSRMFGVLRDISDRKDIERSLRGTTAALEREVSDRTAQLLERVRERDLLLHELQHRVKNNLQMILALISMQKRRVGEDAQRILQDVMQRISAIGFVYDIMLRRHDIERTNLCEVLDGLCEALNRAHVGRIRIEMTSDTQDCTVPAEKAVNLAVVANEIISNAMKYAFPDGRTGTIKVRLGRVGREWSIVIEDDGVGFAEEAPRDGGFGLVVSRSILRNMNGGRLERVPQSGTRFDVVFGAGESAAATD
jgi:two-component sensor histidine kinase